MPFKTTRQAALDRLKTVIHAVSDAGGKPVQVHQDPPDNIHELPAAVLFQRWSVERVNSNRLIHIYLKIQVFVGAVGGRTSGKYDEIHKAARDLCDDIMEALDADIALAGTISNSEYGDDTSSVIMLETVELAYGSDKYIGFEIPLMLRFHQSFSFG